MAGRTGKANKGSLRLDGNFFRFNRDGKYDQGLFNSVNWSVALREAKYSFSYGYPGGYIINVRREKRANSNYWYAFKHSHGKTRKVYVGKVLTLDSLRLARLNMAKKLGN